MPINTVANALYAEAKRLAAEYVSNDDPHTLDQFSRVIIRHNIAVREDWMFRLDAELLIAFAREDLARLTAA